MRRNPAVFNPPWSIIYPFLYREDKYVGSEYVDRQEAFRTIFEENRWGSSESRSGCGSTVTYTKPLRKSLERLLKVSNVKIFLDAPCGDFNWMQYVSLPDGTRYIGGDIVDSLIHNLQQSHGGKKYSFQTIDIVEGPLPAADLWLCRDVLFHLSNQDIHKVLTNFSLSSIPHILNTTYNFVRRNEDVRAGGFRFINLRQPPFMLPPPLSMTPDFIAPEPPRYLGLWSREQVRKALT